MLLHHYTFPGDRFSKRFAAVSEIYSRVPESWARMTSKTKWWMARLSSWRLSLGVGGACWLVGGVNFRAGSYGSGRRLGSSGKKASRGNAARWALEDELPSASAKSRRQGNSCKQMTNEKNVFSILSFNRCDLELQIVFFCILLDQRTLFFSSPFSKIVLPSQYYFPVYKEAFPVEWHTPLGVSCLWLMSPEVRRHPAVYHINRQGLGLFVTLI